MSDINVTVNTTTRETVVVEGTTQVVQVNSLGGGVPDLSFYLPRAETGQFVTRSETGNFGGGGGGVSGDYVLHSETGSLTGTFALKSQTGGFLTTGQSGQFYSSANPSGYLRPADTGIISNSFYPLNSNPAGYLTGSTGGVVNVNQTGQFYAASNPNGYITSTALVPYVQTGQTGQFYANSNPSGYITSAALSPYVLQSATGVYTGIFYPLIGNPSGFILASQSGQFYASSNPNGYITVSSLIPYVQTGQTGIYSNSFYPLNSNPNGYLTGSTGGLASTGYVTGVSGALDSRLASTGNFLYGLIQASSAGVSSINGQSGSITFTGAGNVVVSLAGQAFTFSGDTGAYANFVLKTSTGSFITTGQTGILVGQNQTGALANSFVSFAQTGVFYASNNPSGYITTGYVGKFAQFGMFVDNGTGLVATGAKGYFQIGYTMQLKGWTVIGSSGDLTVDIRKSNFSTFPTFTSIASGIKPNMTGAVKNNGVDFTNWNSTINNGDFVQFVVLNSTVTQFNLTITGLKYV